jgi:hypothetical protein
MSRLEFPAPPDELATEIRHIDRPLFVADPNKTGSGEEITADEINQVLDSDEWGHRRLMLQWKGAKEDWLLVQDEAGTGTGSGV